MKLVASLLSSRLRKRARHQNSRTLAVESLEQRHALAALVAIPDTYTVNANEAIFVGPSGKTLLTMHSDPGDYIGQGRTYALDSTTGSFSSYSPLVGFRNGIRIDYHGNDFPSRNSWWTLGFSAPSGSSLLPGRYLGAMRYVVNPPGTPGLEVYGEGRGSNQLSGEFDVRAVDFDDNDVAWQFHATFEQHSEHKTPALRGEIFYNMPAEFPGVLANDTGGSGATLRSVLVTDSAHGRVALKDDGSFAYRPNPNYAGLDTFQYLVTDGFQTSDPVTVTINVISEAPAQLAFLTTVADVAAGQGQDIRVAVQDADGNINAADNLTTIVLEVGSGPGSLMGGTSATVVNGIATFPATSFEVAGRYTLHARSGEVIATSNDFLVSPAAPASLSITSMPSTGHAGARIEPGIRVSVVDRYGNVVTSAPRRLVTIDVASGPGQFASPRTTKTWTAAGTALFSALMVRRPGAYTFRLASAGLPTLVSPSFVAVAPTRLLLQVTPRRNVANTPVTLTARVSVGRLVLGMPTAGTVSFYSGDIVLGTSTLMGGKATLRLQGIPEGVHRIRAVFGGSDGFLGSSSDVVTYALRPGRAAL